MKGHLTIAGVLLATICASARAGLPQYHVGAADCPCLECAVDGDQPVSLSTSCTVGNITRSMEATAGYGFIESRITVDDYCNCGTVAGVMGGGGQFQVNDLVFSGPPGATSVTASLTLHWDYEEAPAVGGYTEQEIFVFVTGKGGTLFMNTGTTTVPAGAYTTNSATLPLNYPIYVDIRAGVRCVTQSWPNGHAYASGHGRLGFHVNEPVFNLPPGYTANSPSLNIVNNFWVPPPVPGDLDGDGDVDLIDFSTFSTCFTGPGVTAGPECVLADLDSDGDVDLTDFATFSSAFTG